jgi:predicted NBD/HSP70 family sugar kinase
MRSINQTAVFEYIRMKKLASRAVIASELDISLPSVVRIVDDLLKKRYLRFSGQMEGSGGRKRPLIEINSDKNCSIGVLLSAVGIHIALLDLGGTILESEETPIVSGKAEKSLSAVFAVITRMIKTAKKPGHILRGISVSVPGIVNHQTGTIVAAPTINWRNVPVKRLLTERYQLPVIVENDATLAILGEMWYGFGQECFNLFLFEIDMGLGAGLVIDGAIYRGADNSAGEIGNAVFDKKFFSLPKDAYGPMELDIAGVGLLRKIRNAGHDKKAKTKNDKALLKMLFDAYQKKEKWTLPVIENFIDNLAMSIITVHSIVNPELIVLRGCVMDFAGELMEEVKQKTGNIKIKISEIGANAEILGGAVNLIYEALDYQCLHPMY